MFLSFFSHQVNIFSSFLNERKGHKFWIFLLVYITVFPFYSTQSGLNLSARRDELWEEGDVLPAKWKMRLSSAAKGMGQHLDSARLASSSFLLKNLQIVSFFLTNHWLSSFRNFISTSFFREPPESAVFWGDTGFILCYSLSFTPSTVFLRRTWFQLLLQCFSHVPRSLSFLIIFSTWKCSIPTPRWKLSPPSHFPLPLVPWAAKFNLIF